MTTNAPPPHDSARQYFTVLSNGRTGSTWLLMMLSSFSGVAALREAKWRPYGYAPKKVHFVLNSPDDRLVPFLDALHDLLAPRTGKEIRVLGTKLVFDPHNFIDLDAISHIRQCLGETMRIIHLRRSYRDIFLSWNARGVWHALNKNSKNLDIFKLAKEFVESAERKASERPLARAINITGLPFDHNPHAPDPALEVIDIEFTLVVEKILIYFYYDLVIAEIMRHFDHRMFIHYENIPRQLADIASFVGSGADDTGAKFVLSNPLTLKLPELGPGLVSPQNWFEGLCSILDRAIERHMLENRRLSDVFEWNQDYTEALVKIPEIQEIMPPHAAQGMAEPGKGYRFSPQHFVVRSPAAAN